MRNKLLKLITLAMFVAIGVVVSPLLRVEGFAPTAHLVNVVVAVFMGPWYALGCGIAIAVTRMVMMGIPPLALTGQIFGAFFAGLLYRMSKGKLIFATLGEVIGTGIIGSIISYPVMRFIMGRGELSLFFYMPSFTIASIMGGSVAYVLLKTLQKAGVLSKIQVKLGGKSYEKQS
jgi:energy coupling factor transporter S component ThiW